MEDHDHGDDDLPGRSEQAPAAAADTHEAAAPSRPGLPDNMEDLQAALGEWESTFEEERGEGGAFAGIMGRIHPLAVLNELRRALSTEREARAESGALRQRLAAAACESAAHARADVVLRRELHAARAVGEPSVLQLRQLLLDPAVNREFSRLRAEAAAATEELRVLRFAVSDPKGFHAMASKLRAAEERCEWLGEGRVAQVERSLALARTQLEDMRRQYGELEDHAHSLDEEAEALKMEVLALRRAAAAAAAARPSGPPESAGGGPPEHRQGGPFVGPKGHPGPEHHHHPGGPFPGTRGPQGPPHPGWGRGPPPPFGSGRGGPPPGFHGGGRGGPPLGKRPRDY